MVFLVLGVGGSPLGEFVCGGLIFENVSQTIVYKFCNLGDEGTIKEERFELQREREEEAEEDDVQPGQREKVF